MMIAPRAHLQLCVSARTHARTHACTHACTRAHMHVEDVSCTFEAGVCASKLFDCNQVKYFHSSSTVLNAFSPPAPCQPSSLGECTTPCLPTLHNNADAFNIQCHLPRRPHHQYQKVPSCAVRWVGHLVDAGRGLWCVVVRGHAADRRP